MLFSEYFITSLYVFTLCFILGILLDKFFEQLTQTYKSYTFPLAILQLFSVISLSYVLHKYIYLESYNPHVLFSTFLFSLQITMITNLKSFLYNIS